MVDKNSSDQLDLMLLREAIWGLEDKINSIIEALADIEADTIRFKRLATRSDFKLSELEKLKNQTSAEVRNE